MVNRINGRSIAGRGVTAFNLMPLFLFSDVSARDNFMVR